jgi:uncharacterized protein YbaP (TraB family)
MSALRTIFFASPGSRMLQPLLLGWIMALVLGLFPPLDDAQAKGYIWTDKNGVTHITDKPPADAAPPAPKRKSLIQDAPSSSPINAPASTPTGKLFMWKVVSNTNVVYLLGSVHAAKKGLYPLNPRIEDAFRSSAALAVEADAEANQLAVQALALQTGLYPQGESLEKNISQRTKEKLKEQGFTLALLNKFKPWLAAMTVQSQRVAKLGFDPKLGIDAHFLKQAKESKKEIRELESAAFQLQLMTELAQGKEDLFLYLTLCDLDKMESKYNLIFDYWANGDASKLETLIQTELNNPEFAELGNKLFYQRNKTMADKIDGFLKESKPVFVVVGAGHLVGEKGMVKLLQDKGYQVEQIGAGS